MKNRISIACLVLSIFVAWLLVPVTTGFPLLTFAILFIGLSSLIYVVKKDKTWLDTLMYAGILSFSFFIIYRANEFLQFVDFMMIIFFLSVLVRPLLGLKSVLQILFSPFIIFITTLIAKNIFPYTFSLPGLVKRKELLKKYIPPLIITGIILLVTIPLLASANPLFNDLLEQMSHLLNIDWLLHIMFTDSLTVYLLRIGALLFLGFMIPRALSVTVQGSKEVSLFPNITIDYLLPKIALSVVLIIFFITQFQLYFASPELLKSLGYTNSRLTNEVFVQVTLVAFIVLLLAYVDNTRKKWHTHMTYFLLVQACFLIGIAFKSVYDYSALYGFTQKRLWGYTSMTWLSGLVGAYGYHYHKQTSFQSFIKQVLGFSVVVIVMINILNFDGLIYHTAKPMMNAEIDYKYLSGRSVDAHYYTELLPQLINDIQKSNTPDQSKIQPARKIIRGIERLRDRYAIQISINAFNLAEYQEYQATKDMDIQAYTNILDAKESQLTK